MARITLRVAPGAKNDAIVGPYADGWKVRVSAPADAGKANAAVTRLLARALAIPADSVTIVAGHSSRTKVVEIDHLTSDEIATALAAWDHSFE